MADEEVQNRRRFLKQAGSISFAALIQGLNDSELAADILSTAEFARENPVSFRKNLEAGVVADRDPLDDDAHYPVQHYVKTGNEKIQWWAENTDFTREPGEHPYQVNWGFEVDYMRDEEQFDLIEKWQGPLQFREQNNGQGDCDDWMIYALNIAVAKGFNARAVTAKYPGSSFRGHAYTEIDIDGEVFVSDIYRVNGSVTESLIPRREFERNRNLETDQMFGEDMSMTDYEPDWHL